MAGGIGQERASVKTPTAFISHASQDAALANAVVAALERAGLVCWIAPRDVVPGALYAGEIVRAINESSLVVLVLSAHSVASTHVGKELERACSKRRRIIALRTDAAILPDDFEYFLSESQWIEVGAGGIEPAAARLTEAVQRYLGSGLRTPAASNTTFTADSPADRLPSIAVLPFANMSGDKEQEYFSDGLAEEIINALVQIAGLRVIARTSAFAFKGRNTDIRDIARTLEVDHVLEGSVRRSGNRIRVTAQLIAASNRSHLWSERYDRELADVFEVQDEISAAIASALKVKLSPQVAAATRHEPALPAYEALLKARHFHWKATAKTGDQARQFHEQAIALDPQYALAHAMYAEHLIHRAGVGHSPLREVAPAIRTLAQRALQLDPSIVEAHGALCVLAAIYDYDWHEAGRQFALATSGGRASQLVQFSCGIYYFQVSGRRQEALAQLQRAVQADPLNPIYRGALGGVLIALNRYEEAEEILLQSRDLDPDFYITNQYLAGLYIYRQKFAEALPFSEKAFSLAPRYAPTVGVYAALLVRMGEPHRGHEIVKALGAGEAYGASRGLAHFYALCGDLDAAADWSVKAIEERDPSILIFLQSKSGETLRASPRWPELAALMNLPEAQKTLAN